MKLLVAGENVQGTGGLDSKLDEPRFDRVSSHIPLLLRLLNREYGMAEGLRFKLATSA